VSAVGNVKEGQWVEGKLSGHCRKTYSDGHVVEGLYREGVKVCGGVVQQGTRKHTGNGGAGKMLTVAAKESRRLRSAFHMTNVKQTKTNRAS
jgi:hypothetical protein